MPTKLALNKPIQSNNIIYPFSTSASGISFGYTDGIFSQGDANLNISLDFVCEEGEYLFKTIADRSTNRGILTFTVDGVTTATIDTYGTGSTGVSFSSNTFNLSRGRHSLVITNATKNVSSSNYYVYNVWPPCLCRTATQQTTYGKYNKLRGNPTYSMNLAWDDRDTKGIPYFYKYAASSWLMNSQLNSKNSTIYYYIDLPNGKSVFRLYYVKASGCGIFRILVDGVVAKENIDSYASTATFHNYVDVVIDGFGRKKISIETTGKNESSSGYRMECEGFVILPSSEVADISTDKKYNFLKGNHRQEVVLRQTTWPSVTEGYSTESSYSIGGRCSYNASVPYNTEIFNFFQGFEGGTYTIYVYARSGSANHNYDIVVYTDAETISTSSFTFYDTLSGTTYGEIRSVTGVIIPRGTHRVKAIAKYNGDKRVSISSIRFLRTGV